MGMETPTISTLDKHCYTFVNEQKTCPCHPIESQFVLDVTKAAVRLVARKAIEQLARDLATNSVLDATVLEVK